MRGNTYVDARFAGIIPSPEKLLESFFNVIASTLETSFYLYNFS